VVCRIKPYNNPSPCVIVRDDEHVRTIPPTTVNRNGEPQVERIYRFGHVFDGGDSQKEVFKRCCYDFVEDLVAGRNSLLFAYGVTSSGKTYTMTGRENALDGILPRAADVLFNSLPELAPRCVFYPDGKNGFHIRSELEASLEQIKERAGAEFEVIQRTKEWEAVGGKIV
jgi:kinesin family protein 23